MKLRLIADDLTGALDTAARFTGLTGPARAVWDRADVSASGSIVLDVAARDVSADAAISLFRAAAPMLRGADIAYLKLDSLLRGHPAQAIAACLAAGDFAHCVVAPAFPAQGRITRGGRQWARSTDGSEWHPAGLLLADALRALGQDVAHARPGQPAPSGISVWDAETDADLDRIVLAGRALHGSVLWCGTAGLAGALASKPAPVVAALPLPFLALIGSDHAVSAAQIREASQWHVPVAPDDPRAASAVAERLEADGAAVVTSLLPEGLKRHDAAARIAATFDELARILPATGTLFAAGGETLRGICMALAARGLSVQGEFAPGVPASRLMGGRHDGLLVLSKSGAFGDRHLLRRMIGHALERSTPDMV